MMKSEIKRWTGTVFDHNPNFERSKFFSKMDYSWIAGKSGIIDIIIIEGEFIVYVNKNETTNN